MIFGGMNNQNYIGSSIFVIDLDSHTKPDYKIDKVQNMVLNKLAKFEQSNSIASKSHKPVKRQISMDNFNALLPSIK